MKGYVKPLVIETNEMTEGVFANFGSGVEESYDYNLRWTNQNSGSHSDLHFDLHFHLAEPRHYLKVTITFVGKGNIVSVGGYSGRASGSFSNNTIVFEMNDIINPTENLTLGFNNVIFDSCGDGHREEGKNGSYYKTETHMEESANDVFQIDVYYS